MDEDYSLKTIGPEGKERYGFLEKRAAHGDSGHLRFVLIPFLGCGNLNAVES